MIQGQLVPGHKIASGQNPDSPYPDGSIALQIPHFKRLGLDLTTYHPATLNLSIAPARFRLQRADYCFENLQWVAGFHPETFSFVGCEIRWRNTLYPAYVYYPHPETKTRDFHNDGLLEIIAPFIDGVQYGDKLELLYSEANLFIQKSNPC